MTAQSERRGRRGRPYSGFLPWLVFILVARLDEGDVRWAALAALGAAVLLSLPSIRARSVKILEIGGIALFAAFALFAFTASPAHAALLTRYGRAISLAALALIAFASLLVMPFTEQYAREAVPPAFWEAPLFRRANVVLTTAWGFVFLIMSVSHVVARQMGTRRAHVIFDWIVPIAAVLIAIRLMAAYRGRLGARISARRR
ncbi:MAG TPA: hypothetical protein VGT40_13565 [Methylomirabilota bacterium]|nr:hypothetical protein [Methylomirabilota bacterium]